MSRCQPAVYRGQRQDIIVSVIFHIFPVIASFIQRTEAGCHCVSNIPYLSSHSQLYTEDRGRGHGVSNIPNLPNHSQLYTEGRGRASSCL
ncbi:hypothetical protein PoB_007611000 [Plakobranchus ocellatus]|uniref:Uncharacterized protein n=1 Tax=Plakobranchus ocellatus TaxID=259542 RepID=A0AAV4DZV6_9GAST|nr:hypothetical protein PoB_007611000 [Plakobranchus ocellatus]